MPQGNYRKATEPYIELLLEVVAKAPQEFGYEFGRWTGERLSTYLEQQTGIKLSSKQVIRILQKKTTFTFGRSLPGGILPPESFARSTA